MRAVKHNPPGQIGVVNVFIWGNLIAVSKGAYRKVLMVLDFIICMKKA